MGNYKVTCLGKKGTTYNYIIDGTDCLFSSGTEKVVNETIANILKQQKLANGKSLFNVELKNDTVVSKVVEKEAEPKVVTSIETNVITDEPEVIKVPVNNKKTFPSFKKDSGKKQDKLI
jgi:hypothetical protein